MCYDCAELVLGELESEITILEISKHALKREVVIVKQENERLNRENKRLKDRLSKDSQNSNKPPSSDGLKKRKKTKSLRSKSGRKPGAQPGHKGTTLKMVAFADQVQHHRLDSCPSCCADLSAVEVHAKDRRQVFDLPKIKIEVSEHRIEGKCCPVCGEQAWSEYPPGVNSLVQYGPNIKALGVYLKQYQMISYQRACDLMEHLFGRSPCPGSLYNAERKAYEELATFEVQLRCRLIEASPTPRFGEFGSHEIGGDFLFVNPLNCTSTGPSLSDQEHWIQLPSDADRNTILQHLTLYPGCSHQNQAIRILSDGAIIPPENMVFVPGGTFRMGSENKDAFEDEKPIHSVTISDFFLSRHELPFDEYNIFCDDTEREKPDDGGWGQGNRPVINVSWFDAIEYCNWRSEHEGLDLVYTIIGNQVTANWDANGYRLPTEAECEFAARSRGLRPYLGWYQSKGRIRRAC